ncbi:MAG: hypothetical protein ACYS0G_07970, partial [Planctomycetota bacterium]
TDRQQRIADSIGRVVEALEELIQPPPPSEFARQQGGGGGGGGGGEQAIVPPIAELRLIRGMQEQIYDLTRNLNGRADLPPAERSRRHEDLGQDQRVLMDLGQQILRDLTEPPVDADSIPGVPEG